MSAEPCPRSYDVALALCSTVVAICRFVWICTAACTHITVAQLPSCPQLVHGFLHLPVAPPPPTHTHTQITVHFRA
jgi:hypothetical protein